MKSSRPTLVAAFLTLTMGTLIAQDAKVTPGAPLSLTKNTMMLIPVNSGEK